MLSVILAGVLPYISASIKTNDKNETLERIAVIEKGLYAYFQLNGDLPCPAAYNAAITDTLFGRPVADCTSTVSGEVYSDGTVGSGAVPTKALGISDEHAFDGWGRRFSYHVSLNSVGTGDLSDGVITVNDHGGSARTTQAVYVLISHGPNGHGGFTIGGTRYNSSNSHPSELENCDCTNSAADGTHNAVIVQGMKIPAANPSQSFDDITRYQMKDMIEQRDKPVVRADVIESFSSGHITFDDNIALNDNYISNDGDDEGIRVDNDGNVSMTNNLTVAGSIRPGDETNCDGTNEGAIRYNPAETQLEFCDGTDWSPIGGSFSWSTSAWSNCSTSCGNGTQTRTVQCVNAGGVTVANSYCAGSPPSTSQPCFTTVGCTYSWQYGGWSGCVGGSRGWSDWGSYGSCSASCGGGTRCRSRSCVTFSSGTQTRSATCRRSDGATVTDSFCSGSASTSRSCTPSGGCSGSSSNCSSCNTGACTPVQTGNAYCFQYTFGPCTGSCGGHSGCRSTWIFNGSARSGGCSSGHSMRNWTGTSYSCWR